MLWKAGATDFFVIYDDGCYRAGNDGVGGDSDKEVEDANKAFYEVTATYVAITYCAYGCESVINCR